MFINNPNAFDRMSQEVYPKSNLKNYQHMLTLKSENSTPVSWKDRKEYHPRAFEGKRTSCWTWGQNGRRNRSLCQLGGIGWRYAQKLRAQLQRYLLSRRNDTIRNLLLLAWISIPQRGALKRFGTDRGLRSWTRGLFL